MLKYTTLFFLLSLHVATAMYAAPRRQLASANHFSWLPTLTPDQKRIKCQMKLTFSCDCADATSAYKVSKTEPEHIVHPFCESNPTHKWCVGACHNAAGEAEDYPRKQLQLQSKLGTDATGVVVSTDVPNVVACHEKAKTAEKDFFDYDPVNGTCRVATTRGTYLQQQAVGSTSITYMRTDSETGCKALNPYNKLYKGNLNPARSYSMKLRGHVISLGKITSASKTVTKEVDVAACETAAGDSTYYSFNSALVNGTGDCTVSDDYVVTRRGACRSGDLEGCTERVYGSGQNELRMCNAEDGMVDLCDESDSMCHSTPRIDRIGLDNLNFDQTLVHATYSKIGKVKQCNYDGDVVAVGGKLDRQVYPLAPCPSTEQPYYCDFPRNARFGDRLEIIDYQYNGTTNFKCEPDVTILLENTKIEDGIVSVVTNAYECEMTAKNASAATFSYQDTYSVCVKAGNELVGEDYDNELKCERVYDQTWTIKDKKECIIPLNDSTTVAQDDAVLYKIHKRDSVGLPDGIREYTNGYDRQTLQFSYEMQEPVSASMAINELSTTGEAISMNIFTVGRLLKDKIVLTSQQEGSNEQANNDANVAAIMAFFDTMALSGDDIPLSEIKQTRPDSAEWFPLDVGTQGVVDKHRCHTVADSTIVKFRNFTDVRTDFIDKFFASADEVADKSPCGSPDDPDKYDIAVLDDDRADIPLDEQFKRCPNNVISDNFLYPSLRKSFFNPITSDGYRSGFMKGQRFIKEYGRSTVERGTVSDGTTAKKYYHDAMMVAFNTEQLENCNTEMPDKSGFKILKTRDYPDSVDDGIDGNFGRGYDENMYQRWGTRFCRSTITVTKYGKNPDTVVYQGYPSDVTGKYIKEYAYKVEITEEDCSDIDIREEQPIAEGTTAAFNVQEAEEVVRITAATEPDWCRTETGHYDSKQMDYSDGGVCLSHKQIARKGGLSEDHPYGSLGYSTHASCVEDNSKIDVTTVYGSKSACEGQVGHTWYDFVGHEQSDSGRCFRKSDNSLQTDKVCLKNGNVTASNETFCVVDGGQYLDPSVRADCEKVSAFEWKKTDISFGYVASVPNASMTNLRTQTLSFTHVNADHYTVNEGSEQDPTLKLCAGDRYTIERATAGHALNIKLGNADQFSANVTEGNPQIWTPATGTYQYYCVAHPATMLGNITVEDCPNIERMEWEDSRLSCAHMGTSSGRSKYDRIRLPFFVDVLVGKDLFDEGKVNAGILPRGIPTGITEGAGSKTEADACEVCEKVSVVGQHKLGGDDIDDARENITDVEDKTRKQRFEDGYRAVGYGKNPTETYERVPPGNIQGKQDFNELVQILDEYVVRDIGSDEAGGGSEPFIDDSLTTISYLGLATSSMDPLVQTTQKVMEDEGDGKIYARYLVEMFSADCLDRTQPHVHSSHLQIQLFKDGRWPAERLADAETCNGDGEGLDITTTGALARASPNFDSAADVTVDTKQVCGPIEKKSNHTNEGKLCDNGEIEEKIAMVFRVEQTGKADCLGAATPLSGQSDIQLCASLAHAGGFNRIVFQQSVQCTACLATNDAGSGDGNTQLSVAVSGSAAMTIPPCVIASVQHYCQVCSKETYGCEQKSDSDRLYDMTCAGRDFHDKNARLGLNAKLFSQQGPEDYSNLMIVDIPAVQQTRGSFYGAELVEFSLGVSLLDTIEFEEDQYLTLKGMGSRVEMIAWVRNTDLGNSAKAQDVRNMGDLVYPQITTEEVVITAQSFDRERDPHSWNINIEGVSVCSHAPADYLNSYAEAGVISQHVVDCITTGDPTACDSMRTTCPLRTDTGFELKKEEDNYFLLAKFRTLFGRDGHLFVDNTCDMLAVSRLLEILRFRDYGAQINKIIYKYADNEQGQDAVDNACVKTGAPSADEFFKMVGPQGQQVPASQTIVRNFKALLMGEARSGIRGIREVVPCRRLATHGDDMSFQFRNAILKGYSDETAFNSTAGFGARFEPRDCWMDGFTDSSGNTSRTHAGDSETCMTNILDRLNSEYAFEDYLDSIGPAENFDEMVCTQKNNVWRQGSAGASGRGFNKHIPCPWSKVGLFNFDHSSVEAPAFALTAEEKAYRLSGASPSWDAIVFHPNDIGDLANHYQPDTEDFQLPVKVEILIHGSTCSEEYDPASQRRRLLSFRERKNIRGSAARKLLQLESGAGVTPDARFGGGSSIAFNINVNLAPAAATQSQVIGMNDQGEEIVVSTSSDVKKQLGLPDSATEEDVRKEIYKNTKKMLKESHSCLHKLQFSWVTLSFVGYYVLNFLVAALLAAFAPDLLTNKSPSVFYDPL